RRRSALRGRDRRPSHPTRCVPTLCFPGLDPLLAGVVTALGTDMVRALHALAARTRLERNRSSCLVRVTRALFPLRCTSLGDGHGSSTERVRDELRARPGGPRRARSSVSQCPADTSTALH